MQLLARRCRRLTLIGSLASALPGGRCPVASRATHRQLAIEEFGP
jgi:hypothetical protein